MPISPHSQRHCLYWIHIYFFGWSIFLIFYSDNTYYYSSFWPPRYYNSKYLQSIVEKLWLWFQALCSSQFQIYIMMSPIHHPQSNHQGPRILLPLVHRWEKVVLGLKKVSLGNWVLGNCPSDSVWRIHIIRCSSSLSFPFQNFSFRVKTVTTGYQDKEGCYNQTKFWRLMSSYSNSKSKE